jgi:hypothetical protein
MGAMTLSIITVNIMGLAYCYYVMLSVTFYCYAKGRYSECRICIVMQSVILLSVFVLNVIFLLLC